MEDRVVHGVVATIGVLGIAIALATHQYGVELVIAAFLVGLGVPGLVALDCRA